MSRQISRRNVLLGAAAIGLGGALGAARLGTGAQRVAAQTAATVFPAARVGATFDLFPFCSGTTYPQAVDLWNKTTNTSMRCWKVYYERNADGTGVFPTTIDDRIHTIIVREIQALISFKPSFDPQQQEQDLDNLGNALQMFQAAGLIAEVCLYQEVGPNDMTASQYHQVVKYYGPTVRQFYPLVFDASGSQGPKPGDQPPSEWQLYDPGRSLLDGYAVDYYCGAFHQGIRLDQMAQLAGDLPLGIWEIGNTASDAFFPTPDQLEDYMTYITNFLTSRAAAGLPVGSVAWYNGPASAAQSGANEIAGCDPSATNSLVSDDIAAYQTLYSAVNGLP